MRTVLTHRRFRRLNIPAAVILGGFCMAPTGTLAVAYATPAAATTESAAQRSFASPQAAVDALISALKSDDPKALSAIFGPDGAHLVASGDKVADEATAAKFVARYAQDHSMATQPDGSVILSVGENAWPLPIPLVQSKGKWSFDTSVGIQQIIDRRIGTNELLAIQTLFSCVEAQQDFFGRMQDSTGTGVYAGQVFSTPGQEDGLYWDASNGEIPSPLAPLIAQAQSEGYLDADTIVPDSPKPEPYHGYLYRILKSQGPDAAEGAKNYIVNGKMTGGFAFVAWPAVYGSTGIMTFIINQDGVAFQQDLGPGTATEVAQMKSFNPDLDWARIVPTD